MVALASVKDFASNTTAFSYDPAGNLTSIAYPNGVTDTRTYDSASQLSSITDTKGSTTLASFSYTRDGAGLVTAEADTGVPTAPSSFTYDPLRQLTTASASSFTYDAAQNLTTGPSGTPQAYDRAGQLCWSGTGTGTCSSPPAGATTYAYSPEGNRTSTTPSVGGATTYTYDQANNLTGLTAPSGTSTSYAYDGSGLLQSETTGTSTTSLLWSAVGQLPLLVSDATSDYLYGPGSTPIEQVNLSTGAPSYLLSDQLGSVRAIADPSGSLTAAFSYDAWGNLTGTSGTATTPFRWAGAYYDQASGLYYLRARWYDPVTGAFMSLDPKVASTLEPYSYSANDPLNATDPSGLSCRTRACRVRQARVVAARARAAERRASAAVARAAAAIQRAAAAQAAAQAVAGVTQSASPVISQEQQQPVQALQMQAAASTAAANRLTDVAIGAVQSAVQSVVQTGRSQGDSTARVLATLGVLGATGFPGGLFANEIIKGLAVDASAEELLGAAAATGPLGFALVGGGLIIWAVWQP